MATNTPVCWTSGMSQYVVSATSGEPLRVTVVAVRRPGSGTSARPSVVNFLVVADWLAHWRLVACSRNSDAARIFEPSVASVY